MENRSKIGIGTAQLGLKYGINNSKGIISNVEFDRILTFAIKEGVDVIDTAQSYGDAEGKIGKAIIREPIKTKLKIVTKLSANNIHNIENSIKGSIAKLQCQDIYGVLFHDFESFNMNSRSIDELEYLKQQNIIQKIGFSLYSPKQLTYLLHNKIHFDIVQVPYNIFDRRFESYFSELKSKGIEIHVRSIFLQGLFLSDIENISPQFQKIKHKLQIMREIANGANISINSLCLNFGIVNQNVDKIIIGFDNYEQFIGNVISLNDSHRILPLYNELNSLRETDENIINPIIWQK